MQRFVHSAALCRPAAGVPDYLFADGRIGCVVGPAGKEPHRRLSSEAAIVLPQFCEQDWAEIDVAVSAAFPFLDMDHHPRRVDIGDLERGHLCTTHAGGVQRHQNGAVERGGSRVD